METPVVNVGIVAEKELIFVFLETYIQRATGLMMTGEQRALCINGKILFRSKLYSELYFEPVTPGASFEMKGVVIGVDFHWERKEDQRFRGALNLVVDEGRMVAINQVDVEEYLKSVISSEMSAVSSLELLKAHAVISRSWLLAQIGKNSAIAQSDETYETTFRTDDELIRWYDREDHRLFDVCADDHCQRYQGITRATTPAVDVAVEETRGEVLWDGQSICDARFSKCCGGVTERFETAWEPVPHAYLTAVRDFRDTHVPDLTDEYEADEWIRTVPESYCHTRDKKVVEQLLNNYDQETTNFYRWKISYTQPILASLIRRKSGIDFGEIIDLVPVKRGVSGRIEKLKIVGTKRSFTIGKELEIRRTLSESHLYSSAFVVDKSEVVHGIPGRFLFTGAGWGHGVGLCQIGAAIMGAKGHPYQDILRHYYPGAMLERQY